ncbi:MAG: glycosyltransferase family 2 protein [Ignavibacteriaceae bacterium]
MHELNNLPLISIIFPSWNSKEETVQCIKSLSQLDYPKSNLELIIVDNGSVDGSQESIKLEINSLQNGGWNSVKLVELKENIGIPAAYNEGYNLVHKDSFAVLRTESDVKFDVSCLKELVKELLLRPSVGVVGCLVLDIDGTMKDTGAIYFPRWSVGFHVQFHTESTVCDGVLGCAMLIRREAINKLDYFFDKNLFINKDESDLSIRLKRIGYNTLFDPKAIVYHKGGTSTRKISKISRYYSIRNGAFLIKKYDDFFPKLLKLSYNLIYSLLKLPIDRVPFLAFVDGLRFPHNNKKLILKLLDIK